MDFYGRRLNALKANLHTHSTLSDGQFTPAEVIARYRNRGYDVLAFTDHRTANPVSQYDGEGMVLLSGIEQHPAGPRGIVWHILSLGVPEDFENRSNPEVKQLIAEVAEAGGISFAAHPYWCGFTSAEVMTAEGVAGLEVYNTSTRYIGKEYNMQIWDEILDAGKRYNAIAVDDFHGPADFSRGWTMICTGDRSGAGVLEALKQGHYYASQGPEFSRLSFENGIFEAEFTPCQDAVIVMNRSCGFSHIDGEYTRIRFDATGLPPGSYIRCQIKDKEGRHAWSNPLYI